MTAGRAVCVALALSLSGCPPSFESIGCVTNANCPTERPWCVQSECVADFDGGAGGGVATGGGAASGGGTASGGGAATGGGTAAVDAGECDGGPELRVHTERRYVWLAPPNRTTVVSVVPYADDGITGILVDRSGTLQFVPRTFDAGVDQVYCQVPEGRRFVERSVLNCPPLLPDGGCGAPIKQFTEVTGGFINLAGYVMGRPDASVAPAGVQPAAVSVTGLQPVQANDGLQLAIPSVSLGFFDLFATQPQPPALGDTSWTTSFDLRAQVPLLPEPGDDAYMTQLVTVDAGGFVVQTARVSDVKPVAYDGGALALTFSLSAVNRTRTVQAHFEELAWEAQLSAAFDTDLATSDGGLQLAATYFAIDPIIGGSAFGFYAGLPDLVYTSFTDEFGQPATPSGGAFDVTAAFSNPYPSSSAFLTVGGVDFRTELRIPDAGADAGRAGRVRVTMQGGRVDEEWDGGVVNLSPRVLAPTDVRLAGLPIAACAPGHQVCEVSNDFTLSWSPAATGPRPDAYLVTVSVVRPNAAAPATAYRSLSTVMTLLVTQASVTLPRARLSAGHYVIRIAARSWNRSPQAPYLTSLPESLMTVLPPMVFDVR